MQNTNAKNTIVLQNEHVGNDANGAVIATRTIVVKGKNRPFSNNFVLQELREVTTHFVKCIVRCTKDSKEEGRLYYCTFTKSGGLYEAFSIN